MKARATLVVYSFVDIYCFVLKKMSVGTSRLVDACQSGDMSFEFTIVVQKKVV